MTLLRLLSPASQPAMPLSARLFIALLRQIHDGHLTLVTPEGAQHVFGDPHRQPAATLQVRDWRACRAILRAGDIGFAEAYRAGWIDTPELVALLRLAIRNQPVIATTVTGGRLARLWYALRHRLRMNTRAGSRRNIHAHYDLGNDFYGLWLDDTWTYSSACFDGDAQRSLADAQAAKYQRIVDSLGLRTGMRVLEIGCGWGGFAVHAARQGIRVHGVTISQAQYALATERVARDGLSDRVTLELRDYRDVDGQYDAIVSIEMFEAVGETFWPVYFDTLRQRLKPGARALIQSITIIESLFDAYRTSSDFIREFIFPGGMLPSPERFIDAARRAGLAAEPVLAFGDDYARTLRTWRAAFEARIDSVRAQRFDETFIRTWRLYLAYCEAGFAERRTDVMHFIVSSGG
ncbi:cyclopropane-fatty-acyl-phospholipid synthase [Burkholderia contaminans FFH2055]|uniref:SAM-dependent methyltransferase n=1 Tax=Burkholderia contaminans TaxID=488447 RepID=UPI0006256057|nr:cyclopropane-fatty-acyl-phospholipid synthase family protein [Burkholderia contaminans]KKL35731.1 cyclopropane-fatty-acyl-phospholipid synthase [Burkholderia contaminans FFH2055]MEB4636732.1 cyclopropane-fatty-acyl-phospholipid synthase [Burkholderia contaminans]MEB4651726.1 cyclopropane-fatty-acyl-phospholipid synthase [Burkholderia contaminans]MEB4661296.1 cyclopropane-fatty-acyl-phospholipid synthase [Burkholderia contaminans]MEB4667093.1 cyclopropane-fatty-acyl-phospholipid synthase [Bu